jgi:hypothetical protein
MSTNRSAVTALLGATILAGCSTSSPATHDTPGWDELIASVSSELHALQPSLGTDDGATSDPGDPYVALTRSSPNAVSTNFWDLQMGQCLLWPYDEDLALLDLAKVVPCDERHYGEVYAVGTFPDGDYPVNPDKAVETSCVDDFESYVGIDYWSSELYYNSFYPSEEGWQLGNREWQCYVVDVGYENSGSLKGVGR